MKTENRTAVIGVRLTPEQYKEFNRVAEERYLTASTLGRLLVEKYLRREIRIKGIADVMNP